VSGSAPGRIRLGVVLFILVVVAGVYLAGKFIPPFWAYLSMQDPVKEAALAAIMSRGEEKAKADLMRRAQAAGVPLDEKNIIITREEGMLVVRISWVTTVELPWYDFPLRFRVEDHVPLR